MLRLTGQPTERAFLHKVMEMSGQDLLDCLQCGKCSGSCPIASETVAGPRRLIARILAGMKNEALKDATWWYCVACGTCAGRCPVEINMYEVATALCEIAEAEGVKPSEPDIHLFEELFLKSVQKTGRVRELQAVMQYNLRTFHPFKDMVPGMKLIFKGAISPKEMLPGGGSDPKVARIFSRLAEKE